MSERAYAVCVYCSAGSTDSDHLALATHVGTEIAARGWQLVSGGGNVSMMGAVATAARAGGAGTVGVIPKHLVHKEVADIEADELVVTDTMRQRKQLMEDRADSFLILPGGIGTLEEFFETWTGAFLGVHDKPVVVLDPTGHYRGLFAWVDELHRSGFVARSALDLVTVVSDLESAFDALRPDSAAVGDAEQPRQPGEVGLSDAEAATGEPFTIPAAGSVTEVVNGSARAGQQLYGDSTEET